MSYTVNIMAIHKYRCKIADMIRYILYVETKKNNSIIQTL